LKTPIQWGGGVVTATRRPVFFFLKPGIYFVRILPKIEVYPATMFSFVRFIINGCGSDKL